MNPFVEIYHFIKTELMTKYPALGECHMFDDEEDKRYKDYYLKFKGNISFKEMKNLYRKIIRDIDRFCNENGYGELFFKCNIYISRLI